MTQLNLNKMFSEQYKELTNEEMSEISGGGVVAGVFGGIAYIWCATAGIWELASAPRTQATYFK
ncbi:class IIb bacteriocin, lactobin A/cerein 7B family [Pseudolactococcus reticulitermitis]|uniref:Bacteriocin-type signal sequence n=1 Tax=Pseudolactococcus reticulitermitis TaxID=2025039 RepID=A0A224X0A4_9LACT|nr:class IIb bacteriocin, lactobin A/cerein 7B family [Lactococcus reticulitermitis]GAX47677.1 hypothetical protein RsY01_1278 [Lactococcus reticulitermitis]GHU45935.1 hypothetical protein FACS1894194_2720 [Bacilli bacterium]